MLKNAKKTTQNEIARLVGVCQGTVSTVLTGSHHGNTRVSPAVREKILEIARAHNYIPNMQARSLRGCKNNLIGVLLNYQLSQHFVDMVRPLEIEIHKQHKRMIMGQFGDDYHENEQVLKDFINLNLDGIVVMYSEFKDAERLLKTYQPFLPPMVFLDAPPAGVSSSYVEIDYATGMERLVSSLHDIGCRRLAICLHNNIHHTMVKRLAGYREGLRKNGIPYEDILVYCKSLSYDIDAPQKRIHEAALQFLEANPDVILCSNDQWAIWMLKDLARMGIRVPQDVLLAGYDNTPTICLASTPELTSVRQEYDEIARKMISLLDAPPGTTDVVQPIPVIRESCDMSRRTGCFERRQ